MKKQISYSLLELIQKYPMVCNIDEFEGTVKNSLDEDSGYNREVISRLRSYFDRNLPVDVADWYKVNIPHESLIYKDFCGKQINFVRNVIYNLLVDEHNEWEKYQPEVISTHVSKSVRLPVFRIYLEKYGIEIIMRCNIYDWKISITSEKPLEFDTVGLFNTSERVNPLCCEGFPKDKIFGSYDENHSKFTFELVSDYNVYTFFYLLKHYLDNN